MSGDKPAPSGLVDGKRPPDPPPRSQDLEAREEPAPAGLVEDAPSDEDEARMLEAARDKQRRDNPELVALTDSIAKRLSSLE